MSSSKDIEEKTNHCPFESVFRCANISATDHRHRLIETGYCQILMFEVFLTIPLVFHPRGMVVLVTVASSEQLLVTLFSLVSLATLVSHFAKFALCTIFIFSLDRFSIFFSLVGLATLVSHVGKFALCIFIFSLGGFSYIYNIVLPVVSNNGSSP